jgi:hypothetical protein
MRGGEVKENDGGGEFNYDILDILQELLKMPQCTPPNTIFKKSTLSLDGCFKKYIWKLYDETFFPQKNLLFFLIFSFSFYFIIFTFTYVCIHCLCHLPLCCLPPTPLPPTAPHPQLPGRTCSALFSDFVEEKT